MPVTAKGLEGIVAAETRIGDVRGDVGQLIYCGYDINELAGDAPEVGLEGRVQPIRPATPHPSARYHDDADPPLPPPLARPHSP